MIYPLHGQEGSNYLIPSNSYYSEEYARRMCSLYLSDEVAKDEKGKMQRFYASCDAWTHTGDGI